MGMNKTMGLALLMGLGLSACVSERVVLLPQADGRPSAVIVRSGGQEQLLDQPYETVKRRPGGLSGTDTMSKDEVQSRFGEAIAQMPERPVRFTLHFLEGSTELTPESREQFQALREELARRQVAEMLIVGHTDRVGELKANDALSLERAQAMREALKAEGIDAERVEVAGRGEREPLVKTADEVPEPRNRRVVVNVR